ncbi:Uncharacterised protein [Vibrio cholerae]|nr:Uncharacterised protein [Vibrio cholerae]CSI51081.1 Uncharacterised protein [Vibrio cholerae]
MVISNGSVVDTVLTAMSPRHFASPNSGTTTMAK